MNKTEKLEALKNKVLLRFNWCCVICGTLYKNSKENNLHIHHIDRNRSNNDDSNLLSVCRKCHANIHQIIRVRTFKDKVVLRILTKDEWSIISSKRVKDYLKTKLRR